MKRLTELPSSGKKIKSFFSGTKAATEKLSISSREANQRQHPLVASCQLHNPRGEAAACALRTTPLCIHSNLPLCVRESTLLHPKLSGCDILKQVCLWQKSQRRDV